MRKKIYRVLVATMLIAGVIGLSSCGSSKTKVADKPLIGEFNAIDLNGEAISSDVFAGSKLTMVNIWATFCGPCIGEMPDLGDIAREYDSEKFQLVGIVSDITQSGDSKALKIVDETKADYKHIVPNEQLNENFLSSVQVVPTTVFVDSQGKQVGDTYTGAKSKEDWTKIIENLLVELDEEK